MPAPNAREKRGARKRTGFDGIQEIRARIFGHAGAMRGQRGVVGEVGEEGVGAGAGVGRGEGRESGGGGGREGEGIYDRISR